MADAPSISGNLPFYKNPEPLNAEKHGKLGLKHTAQPLGFASNTHIVPITVGEFGASALCYPIIFAGNDKAPLAVMGLRQNENLYIKPDGQFDQEYYLPAFIRRYPFVFAEDKERGNFVVCVDTGSDLVTDKPDTPFFENGQPSEFTNNAIEFLKGFEGQRQSTQRFVEQLEELDLFETKDVMVQQQGAEGAQPEQVKVADYFGVSEEKLKALPADKLVELNQSGALKTIHVHLASLINWQRILARAAQSQKTVN